MSYANTLTGITGIDNILLKHVTDFSTVFSDWVVANFLNDTSIYNGIYGYHATDISFKSLSPTYVHTKDYPVAKENSIENWTAHYTSFEFEGLPPDTFILSFDGKDGTIAQFCSQVLLFTNQSDVEIQKMMLIPPYLEDQMDFYDFYVKYKSVVMVNSLQNTVAGDLVTTSTYSYYTTAITLNPFFLVGPNPFGPVTLGNELKFTFRLPEKSHVLINIYTLTGELVKTLVDRPIEERTDNSFIWSGVNQKDEKVGTGLYLYIFKTDTETKTGKIAFIRE